MDGDKETCLPRSLRSQGGGVCMNKIFYIFAAMNKKQDTHRTINKILKFKYFMMHIAAILAVFGVIMAILTELDII